jgi:hypothetical protein
VQPHTEPLSRSLESSRAAEADAGGQPGSTVAHDHRIVKAGADELKKILIATARNQTGMARNWILGVALA